MSKTQNNSAVFYIVLIDLNATSFLDETVHLPINAVLWSPSEKHDYVWHRTADAKRHKILKADCLNPHGLTDDDPKQGIRLASIMDEQIVDMYKEARLKGKKFIFKCPASKGHHPDINKEITVTDFTKQVKLGIKPLARVKQVRNLENLEEAEAWLEDTGCETVEDARAKLNRLKRDAKARGLKTSKQIKIVEEALVEYKRCKDALIKPKVIYGSKQVSGMVIKKSLKRPKKNGKYTGERYYEVTVMIKKTEAQASGNAWFNLGKTAYSSYTDKYTDLETFVPDKKNNSFESQPIDVKMPKVEKEYTVHNLFKEEPVTQQVDISALSTKFKTTHGGN